jgi:2-polyprenyl-3-methyl-5-hydroxy-6-metoxy-1,4-benzoquinol methylase
MRKHLKGITEEALSLIKTQKCSVLDIGCNDGILLKFYPDNFEKYGVDLSDVAQEIQGNITVVQDIFPSEELIEKLQGKQLDVITSIAMFYDLENPIGFTRGIKRILSPHGVWIFEMSYMPTMLKMNSYDTICHEHLE